MRPPPFLLTTMTPTKMIFSSAAAKKILIFPPPPRSPVVEDGHAGLHRDEAGVDEVFRVVGLTHGLGCKAMGGDLVKQKSSVLRLYVLYIGSYAETSLDF